MSACARRAEPRVPARIERTAAVCALLLAAALRALPAEASVSITQAQGKVLFLKNGAYTWAQISSGQVLEPGDQLKTAGDARATVTFDDGSRVDLNPGTAFTLQQASSSESSLQLKLGSLRAWISKSLNRKFQVRTPTAVCSVRGTEFSVDVAEGGQTRVQMFGGLLAVSDKQGNEVLIKDRQRVDVTDAGLGKVTDASKIQQDAVGDDAKRVAKREVDLRMSKEEVQAMAAEEAKLAEYQSGKALIDVNGNRVRLEQYIVRSQPDQFKLVILNERQDRFDWFFYQGTFNTTLPTDLSVALRQLPGCIGAACQYFLTGYKTGRSNTIDNMLEVATGGHQVDVNNNGEATDAVTAAFDPATDKFVALNVPNPGGVGNDKFYQTLFNNYSLSFNGIVHQSWTQSAAGLAQPGGNIQNTVADVTYTNVTTIQNQPGCAPPDCTYNEIGQGILHDVVYEADGTGAVWDKFESYIISDEGKIAHNADFAGVGAFSGTQFKQSLLKWNFETIVTASEFGGRKIDLVVEPKLFIQSGLIP